MAVYADVAREQGVIWRDCEKTWRKRHTWSGYQPSGGGAYLLCKRCPVSQHVSYDAIPPGLAIVVPLATIGS